MTDSVLVGPADEIKYIQANVDPNTPTRPGWRWLPLSGDEPPYDRSTQVIAGPTYQIAKDGVTRTWTVRAKTAGELDSDKALAFDGMDVVAMKIAFNHENRIRALEGKQPATLAQFKTAVKGLL